MATVGKQDDALLLRIDNREPVPLALLTEMLSAISADYRSATGHDLTLLTVEQGSIILQFVDWIGHANQLLEFGEHIAGLVGAAATGYVILTSKRRKGAKTVLAIVELAAKTGSEVEISHRTEKGETTFVHLTPGMAKDVLGSATAKIADQRKRSDVQPRLPGPSHINPAEKALEEFVITAADRGLTVHDADDGLMYLLLEVLRTLRERPDGAVILDRIKSNLVASGRKRAASLFEELTRK